MSVRVDAGPLRLSVVSSVRSIDLGAVVGYGVTNGGTSLVAWTHVLAWDSKATSWRSTHSAHLRVSIELTVFWLPLPEVTLARARGVVVSWRRTIALVFLSGANQEDLEEGCDQEQ